MLKYIFLAVIGLLVYLSIIRDLYLFGQGQYHPNGKYDSFKSRLLSVLFVSLFNISLFSMTYYARLEGISPDLDFAISFLALSYLLCVNTLNYLSYKKLEERRIIYITLWMDLAVIFVWLALMFVL